MKNGFGTIANSGYGEAHGLRAGSPEIPGEVRSQPTEVAASDGAPRGFRSCWEAGRELARRCEIDGLTKRCFRI